MEEENLINKSFNFDIWTVYIDF